MSDVQKLLEMAERAATPEERETLLSAAKKLRGPRVRVFDVSTEEGKAAFTAALEGKDAAATKK